MLYTEEAIKKRKERTVKIKNFMIVLIYILLVPLLIYNVTLIVQAIVNPNETPSMFGIKTYVIISGSMKPELDIGDIVIVKSAKIEKLQVGDIISYRQGQSVITHRITEIILEGEQVQYKTKGDNNNTEDSGTIGFELIEGKVIKKVPFIGNIALMLQGKISIVTIAIIFYIYIARNGVIKKRKNRRRMKRIAYEKEKNQ
ncbi:MAG: signal peptidase I [Clostridia bacterium]|nr:signal peptidase I [Clostridia bacterium]